MLKSIALPAALAALLVCLLMPALFFTGHVSMEAYKAVFLAASVAWFVFAAVWSRSDDDA
jgi:hypothetical protein